MLLCASVTASAAELALRPASTDVSIRAYGLGFIPFDGKFTRFHGMMRYDPGQPGKCQVMLEIDPSSLQMSSRSITERVIGPDFLDVARYPLMSFSGACTGDSIAGTLDMHGQAHPFDLDLKRDDGRTKATGRLRRADWGMTGGSFSVGRTIRIRVKFPSVSAKEHA